jgi:hypothetical protein
VYSEVLSSYPSGKLSYPSGTTNSLIVYSISFPPALRGKFGHVHFHSFDESNVLTSLVIPSACNVTVILFDLLPSISFASFHIFSTEICVSNGL